MRAVVRDTVLDEPGLLVKPGLLVRDDAQATRVRRGSVSVLKHPAALTA